jgi:hypothetical protein
MRRRSLFCVPAGLILLAVPGIVVAQDTPTIDDAAVSLIARSLAATRDADSMHIKVRGTGSMPGGMDGAASLDDASIDADLDIAHQALAVQADIPSFDLSGLELRIVDDKAYLKAELLSGDGMWVETDAPMIVDLIVSMIPGGPRIANGDPAQERVEAVIRRRLGKADASAAIAGEQSCASGTCTRIHIDAPLAADTSDLFGLFGGLGSVASPGPMASGVPVEPSMTLDVLVDATTTRLDSIVMAQTSDQGDLTVTVTIGAYDAPVTVEAPPPDQIGDSPID